MTENTCGESRQVCLTIPKQAVDFVALAKIYGSDSMFSLMFNVFRTRLSRYFSQREGRLPGEFLLKIKKISDLTSLRNTIVYVHRNGYIADPHHTPMSYPWGTGRYYYNYFPAQDKITNLGTRELRRLFRTKSPFVNKDWQIIDGYVCPSSFCEIELGMKMFRNARHYFSNIGKIVTGKISAPATKQGISVAGASIF